MPSNDDLTPTTRVTITPTEGPRLKTLGEVALDVALVELGRGESVANNQGEDVWRYCRVQEPRLSRLRARAARGWNVPHPDNDPDDITNSWCAAFVSHCFEEAARRLGIALPFKRSHGAKRLHKNVVAAGAAVMGDPAPGDIVCWHREDDFTPNGKGHIGIVEKYENGVLHTIEGNVSGFPSKVRRFKYVVATSPKMRRLVGYASAPAR